MQILCCPQHKVHGIDTLHTELGISYANTHILLNYLALLYVSYYIDGQDYCTTVTDVQQEGTDTLNTNTQVISNSGFSCNGRITSYEISLNRIGGPNVYPSIQVWHPSGSNFTRVSEYLLVSSDIAETANYNLANVSFTGANRIEFQSGDVIGYYLPNSLRYIVWNIQTVGSVSYTLSTGNSLAIFSMNDANTEVDRQPLIQVAFGEAIILCFTIL